jgi:hypothetical protein
LQEGVGQEREGSVVDDFLEGRTVETEQPHIHRGRGPEREGAQGEALAQLRRRGDDAQGDEPVAQVQGEQHDARAGRAVDDGDASQHVEALGAPQDGLE